MVDVARIVLADDHASIRYGYRLILDAQPDMEVVGEAGDGETAVGLAARLQPDVVLADVRMPRLDGIEVVRRLAPETKVIVVTTFDFDAYARAAFQAGACGFLLKQAGPTLLVEAIRAAMAGDALISPSLTVRLFERLSHPDAVVPEEPLTDRELELARLVARGRTNAEVADELFITAGTVKTHLANIQRKLGARNRVEVAAWMWESGHMPRPNG
jgi:DNA-binding NarL/FixJ family response regulator